MQRYRSKAIQRSSSYTIPSPPKKNPVHTVFSPPEDETDDGSLDPYATEGMETIQSTVKSPTSQQQPLSISLDGLGGEHREVLEEVQYLLDGIAGGREEVVRASYLKLGRMLLSSKNCRIIRASNTFPALFRIFGQADQDPVLCAAVPVLLWLCSKDSLSNCQHFTADCARILIETLDASSNRLILPPPSTARPPLNRPSSASSTVAASPLAPTKTTSPIGSESTDPSRSGNKLVRRRSKRRIRSEAGAESLEFGGVDAEMTKSHTSIGSDSKRVDADDFMSLVNFSELGFPLSTQTVSLSVRLSMVSLSTLLRASEDAMFRSVLAVHPDAILHVLERMRQDFETMLSPLTPALPINTVDDGGPQHLTTPAGNRAKRQRQAYSPPTTSRTQAKAASFEILHADHGRSAHRLKSCLQLLENLTHSNAYNTHKVLKLRVVDNNSSSTSKSSEDTGLGLVALVYNLLHQMLPGFFLASVTMLPRGSQNLDTQAATDTSSFKQAESALISGCFRLLVNLTNKNEFGCAAAVAKHSVLTSPSGVCKAEPNGSQARLDDENVDAVVNESSVALSVPGSIESVDYSPPLEEEDGNLVQVIVDVVAIAFKRFLQERTDGSNASRSPRKNGKAKKRIGAASPSGKREGFHESQEETYQREGEEIEGGTLFDVLTTGLGILINCAEHSADARAILSTVVLSFACRLPERPGSQQAHSSKPTTALEFITAMFNMCDSECSSRQQQEREKGRELTPRKLLKKKEEAGNSDKSSESGQKPRVLDFDNDGDKPKPEETLSLPNESDVAEEDELQYLETHSLAAYSGLLLGCLIHHSPKLSAAIARTSSEEIFGAVQSRVKEFLVYQSDANVLSEEALESTLAILSSLEKLSNSLSSQNKQGVSKKYENAVTRVTSPPSSPTSPGPRLPARTVPTSSVSTRNSLPLPHVITSVSPAASTRSSRQTPQITLKTTSESAFRTRRSVTKNK